ncbi:MAG: SpoIID/LytB domain-containing protein [Candidatus Gastranaerophilales bacterium]|nr:SpoIID/LytB domain-containing protein [Candidatus Gastranaerophilales bacterium]
MGEVKLKINIFIIILGLFLGIISTQKSYAIRIGLTEGVKKTYIGSSQNASFRDANTGKLLFVSRSFFPYSIKVYNDNSIAIKIKGRYYDCATNAIFIENPDKKGFLATKRKWYRGDIIIYNIQNSLTVVNSLPLEEYLLGVVPSEMPSKWNIEAHKAQAIAARSYALANLNKRGSKGYDLKDTPQDQAYGGASSETPQTTRAVLSTRGEVLTYDNKIIPAYYHASAGGKTLSAGQVWNHDLPYIQSVNSYDWGTRKSGHGVGMSQHGANNLANKGFSAREILSYFYKDIRFSRLKTKENKENPL